MELNAEMIKKALDWLDSLVGNSNDSDMAQFTHSLLGILYDTCEELTEENERLKKPRHILTPDGSGGVKIETIPSADQIRADTARKIAELLKAETIEIRDSNLGFVVLASDIDRVTQKILEGL